jgi:hypothetical protein
MLALVATKPLGGLLGARWYRRAGHDRTRNIDRGGRRCGPVLSPGEAIRRVDLHAAYGGGRQGGIAPSARTPNVLIFSDPASGEQHGYFDGWHDDGFSITQEKASAGTSRCERATPRSSTTSGTDAHCASSTVLGAS